MSFSEGVESQGILHKFNTSFSVAVSQGRRGDKGDHKETYLCFCFCPPLKCTSKSLQEVKIPLRDTQR